MIDDELDRQSRNATLCASVDALWKQGFDTADIARLLSIREATAHRILSAWRDLRWQNRRAHA